MFPRAESVECGECAEEGEVGRYIYCGYPDTILSMISHFKVDMITIDEYLSMGWIHSSHFLASCTRQLLVYRGVIWSKGFGSAGVFECTFWFDGKYGYECG